MNSDPLEWVTAFLYLRRMVEYNNSDWVALYHNMWKARRRWEIVGEVVSNTGSVVRARGMLYKEVVQSVLLYERES